MSEIVFGQPVTIKKEIYVNKAVQFVAASNTSTEAAQVVRLN